MKVLQIGPYPPPVGGWSFHIKLFKEYLDAKGVVNEVLDIGENRLVKNRGCIDVQGLLDYSKKVVDHCRRGFLIYIHCNGNSVKGLVLALLAQVISLILCRRTIVSFHAGIVQKCFAKGLSIQKILVFVVFRMAGGIVCNSDAVKKCIEKLGVSPECVRAIPCFSIQYTQHKKILTGEEEKFFEIHSPVLSCYLFFREEYDPQTLFRAMRRIIEDCPSAGLVVMGQTEGLERYLSDDEEKRLHNNLMFVGEKDHDGFLSLIQASDIFIRTPVSDGVCSSVMEALALKVPVIASENQSRPDGVISYKYGHADDLAGRIIATLEELDNIKKRLHHIPVRDFIREEYEMLAGHS